MTGLRKGATSLPADLVQDASRRLGIVAVGFAAACVWGFIALPLLERAGWLPGRGSRPALLVMAVGLALGAAVYAVTRYRPLSGREVTALGIGFEVSGGFLIALAEALDAVSSPALGARPGLSWVAVWVTIFPLAVPTTVGLNAAAAFVTASLSPIAWAVVVELGYDRLPGATLPALLIPNYVAAGLATAGAFAVRRMQRSIVEARAMGSYNLVERVGAGGMGEVWRATHRLLARPAAVKLIRPDVLAEVAPAAAAVWLERFRREAEAAATLRSPHTIELYDFGAADDGTFYYVMELLEGIDLQALVDRFGALPPARAAHLLIQACDSLAEAHGRGLIHRDIKPSNIYTCRLGCSVDFVKVLDFGLVRAAAQPERADVALTMPGFMIGTPAYMAPEVLGGDPATDRADVYSLGCVAYWLLTGRLVFEGSSPARMMSRHMFEQPKPPSGHAAQPIPAELDALVVACLSKEPDERPDAREVARRLRAMEGAATWDGVAAERWWQEHLA